MHPTRTLLILLALLLLIAAIAFIASPYSSSITQLLSPPQPIVTPLRQITVTPPPRTKANTTAALKQTMFSVLVSYVDNNFEPKVARVRTGETVRFVNNSTAELNLCGTAFTSCKDLKPGEYWEFNFATVGTWTFENKSNPNMIGTMVVQ
ncbi:MAG: hypothetical protein UY67_C0019G0002 [Candidatus Kaiserbacteria bacterium GW2011_GWA2_52_12]|uniref:EfeO-type cupredoxin-like domain-containing protein n=1 Tax=Candidatus Kaiserbacteria bacterium GW2011_GWA2_52_12 TaxID=1618671 RepID=A0A0G1Z7W5_9BACT|nr:MAG: hypothetical protein UY67_C0019G0002 [Candidatus Kaiserbacteria bacterium GW2011_GWA2_52_12]